MYICTVLSAKENTLNYAGRIFLLLVFFFVVSAFAGTTARVAAEEKKTEYRLHLSHFKAINLAQVTSNYSPEIPLKKGFPFFAVSLTPAHHQLNITVSYRLLQQNWWCTKPHVVCWLHQHLYSPVGDEPALI